MPVAAIDMVKSRPNHFRGACNFRLGVGKGPEKYWSHTVFLSLNLTYHMSSNFYPSILSRAEMINWKSWPQISFLFSRNLSANAIFSIEIFCQTCVACGISRAWETGVINTKHSHARNPSNYEGLVVPCIVNFGLHAFYTCKDVDSCAAQICHGRK